MHVRRIPSGGAGRMAFAGALALAALAGCASLVGARTNQLPRAGPGTTFHAMVWRDRTRTFLLHLPPGARAGAPLPLVIVLHGSGASANVIMDETHLNATADSARYAVVYPNGSGWLRYFLLTWNSGRCCGDALAMRADDEGFLRALILRLEGALPVDSARVYVAGFSDGGRMAYRLACDLAPMLAGVASVSGALPDTTCTPAVPIAVDIFHGTGDHTIPYGAAGARRRRGQPPATVPQTFAWWARRNGCTGGPLRVARDSIVTETYTACRGGSAVELHTILGGAHAWPGGERGWFLEPRPTRGLDASAEMLRFFSTHRRVGAGGNFAK